jgi:acetyltransferase
MESRIAGADAVDMTSAAQRKDTGVTAEYALPADVRLPWPHYCQTADGVGYHVRPIRPDDVQRDHRFIQGLSDSSRVMGLSHEPSAELLNRLVRADYRREMALAAVVGEQVDETVIGIARYGGNPAFCELAMAVADEWQSRGIGTNLAKLLFAHAKAHGVRRLYCLTSANNLRMLKVAAHLRMTLRRSSADDDIIEAWRTL